MSTRVACIDQTTFVPRFFFYQQGHEVHMYVAIGTPYAQLYTKYI